MTLRTATCLLKGRIRIDKAASSTSVTKEAFYSQFRKHTIESSACAAGNRQDDPLVLSRPAHLVVVEIVVVLVVVVVVVFLCVRMRRWILVMTLAASA